MASVEELEQTLRRIDGRQYGAYKDLPRWVAGSSLALRIDHVQGDPFAAPSRVALRVPRARAGFGEGDLDDPDRSLALRDLLARRLATACARASAHRGSGKSGLLISDRPGQQILATTAVLVDDEALEIRLRVGLPAQGRRVLGRLAAEIFLDVLPALAEEVLLASAWEPETVAAHLESYVDSLALRRQVEAAGCVAFVADGALLPRASGVDDRPLADGAVPFAGPESLLRTFVLPFAGEVRGMAIPRGVTLIVGGGYHGKSTLLRALERGVYAHVPGDGRERVVAVEGAVKVRAEDGRSVAGVDLRPFVGDLPGRRTTDAFCTENASGSTSQAAAIMEALEAGASCLLVDEDTSATNVMIRDARMQALIASEHEPLTPFVDRARQLFEEHGVSTVVVMGGSGDWLDVAEHVIGMREYVPWDATARARSIAAAQPTGRSIQGGGFGSLPSRVPDPASLDPRRGKRDVALKARGVRELQYGTEAIELAAVEQLVHDGQVRAIAEAIEWARREAMGTATLGEVLDRVEEALADGGLDALSSRPAGDLAGFRRYELAAALNRLRSLRVR